MRVKSRALPLCWKISRVGTFIFFFSLSLFCKAADRPHFLAGSLPPPPLAPPPPPLPPSSSSHHHFQQRRDGWAASDGAIKQLFLCSVSVSAPSQRVHYCQRKEAGTRSGLHLNHGPGGPGNSQKSSPSTWSCCCLAGRLRWNKTWQTVTLFLSWGPVKRVSEKNGSRKWKQGAIIFYNDTVTKDIKRNSWNKQLKNLIRQTPLLGSSIVGSENIIYI